MGPAGSAGVTDMSRNRTENDPEALIRPMLSARRRYRMGFIATDAALDVFAARLDRWRRGEIEISNIASRPACSLGRDSREESLAAIEALFGERNDGALGPFARRRLRRRLAALLIELGSPRDLLQDMERAAHDRASSLARRRMDTRRRTFEKRRNQLVETQLGIVDRVIGRYRRTPLSRDDLRQEGRAGLIRAADGFDPAQGSPFAAYARFWVRHAILDALARSTRVIRVPHWLNAALSRQARGDEEVAEQGPVLAPRVQGLDDDAGRALPIADERAEETGEEVANRELVELALAGLSALPEREREIVACRFGLEGRETVSRAALARRFGISAQRIGQIEREALEGLRRELTTATRV